MVKQFSPIDQLFPIIEIFSTHVHTYKSNPLFLLSWNIFSLRVNDIFVVNFQAFDHKDLTGYISRMNAHSSRHCNNTKLPRNLYFPSIHFYTSVSLNNNSRSAGEGRFSQWNESEKRRGKFENGKRSYWVIWRNCSSLQSLSRHESATVIYFSVPIKAAGRNPRSREKESRVSFLFFSHDIAITDVHRWRTTPWRNDSFRMQIIFNISNVLRIFGFLTF